MKAGHTAPATLDKYTYTFDKIKAFLKYQYMVSDLCLENIKRSFIHDFEHYLFTVEHLQNNTVMKYLRQTKTVLKMAVEMGWLATDPTSGYRLSFEEKDPMRLEHCLRIKIIHQLLICSGKQRKNSAKLIGLPKKGLMGVIIR